MADRVSAINMLHAVSSRRNIHITYYYIMYLLKSVSKRII